MHSSGSQKKRNGVFPYVLDCQDPSNLHIEVLLLAGVDFGFGVVDGGQEEQGVFFEVVVDLFFEIFLVDIVSFGIPIFVGADAGKYLLCFEPAFVFPLHVG